MAKQRAADLFQGALNSGFAATAAFTILGTGGYILYKDQTRYPRIHSAFRAGSILGPLKANTYEVSYCGRPTLERKLTDVLGPKFSNQYYLISGEVGTGKSRTVLEIVRNMMITAQGKTGAPIYIQAVQGKSLPDSLAEAIKFNFDEHISFKFFLDLVLQIHSLPAKDDDQKLRRVLSAIEKAAFTYMNQESRPVVIVVDGVNNIHPNTLHKLQEKAKLWADCNIVKLVLISNDENTEEHLQNNSSNWSRAAAPIKVIDLNHDEAIAFLTKERFFEMTTDPEISMDPDTAEALYAITAGRIHHLIACKRQYLADVPLQDIIDNMLEIEREKFLHLKRDNHMKTALKALVKADEQGILTSRLVELTSDVTVKHLMQYNIVKFERCSAGVYVTFESRLSYQVAKMLDHES